MAPFTANRSTQAELQSACIADARTKISLPFSPISSANTSYTAKFNLLIGNYRDEFRTPVFGCDVYFPGNEAQDILSQKESL
jgi:hypothetical protein